MAESNGLQATLDRLTKQNEKLRRDIAADVAGQMGLTQSETLLLVERFHPQSIDGRWTESAVRKWLHDQYAGAVNMEEL